MEFLDYGKLILLQLMDLKETLLQHKMETLAYLVIQMIKIKFSTKSKKHLTRFDENLENSLSFNVEYSECHELDGIFKMLSKKYLPKMWRPF